MSENSLTNDGTGGNCPIAYRAVFVAPADKDDPFVWQARWYDASSLNEDGYERGGFYQTPSAAIDAAKRGKKVQDMFERLIGKS